jgi:ketosteroid isomerase-like protein
LRGCEAVPKTAAMSVVDPHAFAARWCAQWNAHDLDGLLAHFTEDVVFTSPVAARVLGGDGVVRGKDALGAYWQIGLEKIPDLQFEVVDVYSGIDTVVINYRNHLGSRVCEVLTFDEDGLVREGHATYLSASNPEGATA